MRSLRALSLLLLVCPWALGIGGLQEDKRGFCVGAIYGAGPEDKALLSRLRTLLSRKGPVPKSPYSAHDDFLRAIAKDPTNEFLKLQYADYLGEQGLVTRALFIRLSIAAKWEGEWTRAGKELREPALALLNGHPDWIPSDLRNPNYAFVFEDGFIKGVRPLEPAESMSSDERDVFLAKAAKAIPTLDTLRVQSPLLLRGINELLLSSGVYSPNPKVPAPLSKLVVERVLKPTPFHLVTSVDLFRIFAERPNLREIAFENYLADEIDGVGGAPGKDETIRKFRSGVKEFIRKDPDKKEGSITLVNPARLLHFKGEETLKSIGAIEYVGMDTLDPFGYFLPPGSGVAPLVNLRRVEIFDSSPKKEDVQRLIDSIYFIQLHELKIVPGLAADLRAMLQKAAKERNPKLKLKFEVN